MLSSASIDVAECIAMFAISVASRTALMIDFFVGYLKHVSMFLVASTLWPFLTTRHFGITTSGGDTQRSHAH